MFRNPKQLLFDCAAAFMELSHTRELLQRSEEGRKRAEDALEKATKELLVLEHKLELARRDGDGEASKCRSNSDRVQSNGKARL